MPGATNPASMTIREFDRARKSIVFAPIAFRTDDARSALASYAQSKAPASKAKASGWERVALRRGSRESVK